jgi:transcriptional regulator GlxA family with amidase domain
LGMRGMWRCTSPSAMPEALEVLSEALDLRGALDRASLLAQPPSMVKRDPRHLKLVWSSKEKRPTPRSDAPVERAIALLRADLCARWTVTSLARRVALSRPVLARRFTTHTGLSPMRYLAELRMKRAVDLLAEDERALASIAAQVGYASEFAFNRAFKRHHGIAPGTFRRIQRSASLPSGFRAAA